MMQTATECNKTSIFILGASNAFTEFQAKADFIVQLLYKSIAYLLR